jgi:hypothetical protein
MDVDIEDVKIYRVRVTLNGATISCEGMLVDTVPVCASFDRHLALALDYIRSVEKRRPLFLERPPHVGIQVSRSDVLSREYLVVTEPFRPE